jgi:hypothetical protein
LKAEEIDVILEVGVKDLPNTTQEMYQQASDWEGRGFGPFSRCLHFLSVCDGNTQEAQDLLSKMIMKKGK